MNTLLLIDGNAIMHRAFHALPPMNASDGTPTNAVYGFLTMLQKSIQDFGATHVIVCFDTPATTFRKKLHKEYQSHRPNMDDGMSVQFPLVKELLDKGGIQRCEKPGFEADDVIGTLAEKAKQIDDFRVFILTGDRDIMQLVDSNVFVITPLKGVTTIAIYNEENVLAKFGITPKQIPDLKALMGDASDNYHGAKGIGPKTAVKLLNQFHNVENLLSHIDEIKEDRIKNLVESSTENIELSKQLATISREVDVPYEIDSTLFTGFKPAMRDELQRLELFSLLGRLFGQKNNGNNNTPNSNSRNSNAEVKKKESKPDNSPQLDLF